MWTVAAAAAVAVFSLNAFGNPWSETPKTESLESRDDNAEAEAKHEKIDGEEDPSRQVLDSREDDDAKTTVTGGSSIESSIVAEENTEARTVETGNSIPATDDSAVAKPSQMPETLTPPSTPLKTTAKGKKWRDRLSAKKQLKLKLHHKHRHRKVSSSPLQEEEATHKKGIPW